jgi:AcrR family transcriptional regulator
MPTSPADRRLRPRKEPRQVRSYETRARILDAARRVFATHGYSAGTTNRIAAEASLSVGSLYQYFPNKDAILVELVEAHLDEGAERVTQAVDGCLSAHAPGWPPLDVLVGTVVGALVELHATERPLHRVLFEQAPRPPELIARFRATEAAVVDRAAALLAGHPEVAVDDTRIAARMAVDAIESLVHRVVTDESSGIPDDRFRTELVHLVVSYLRTPPPA